MSSTSTNSGGVKICRVCGDVATAHNFGGLSCDSCKIFFRRNALNLKKLECYFDGYCQISLTTRRHCPKCRLVKCYSIGMEAFWLQKKIKTTNDSIHNYNNCPNIPFDNEINEITIRSILQSEMVKYENNLLVHEKSPLPLPTIELTTYELEYFLEIQNSISIFENENALPLSGKAQTLTQAFSLPGLYAKKIIRFCKNISHFKSLSVDDQFTILKPFYTEICAVRFAFNYGDRRGGVAMIGDESSNQAILFSRDVIPDSDFVRRNALFMESLKREMDNDVVIRNLLVAQFLFAPRDKLIHPEPIRYRYHGYHYLIKRYLQHKYRNVVQAEKKYSMLMFLLNKYLQVMIDDVAKIFSKFVDLSQVDRVMAELHGRKQEN